MKILITGAAGFIGSNSVDFLTRRYHKVLALDNFSTGKLENLSEFKGKVEPCDITDLKHLDQVFGDFRPKAVLHLAAQSAITTSILDPQKDLSVNALGTLNVLMMARKYNVSKFVFSSTSAVYGAGNRFFSSKESDCCIPNNPYGISKLSAENYIRTTFKDHVILRYANVYGQRQQPVGQNQVIARAFRHFLFGDDFTVNGNGDQKRDFVHVSDICNANFLALTGNFTGTFNIASGKSFSVNTVLSEIAEIYGVSAYQWLHNDNTDERGNVHISSRYTAKRIGWKAYISLKNGLELTKTWWDNVKTDKGNR